MKIAILSFYTGSIERGAENWVESFSRHFSKKHQLTVISSGFYSKRNANDSKDSFSRYFFLDYWSRKIALYTLRNLSEILFKKHDIVIPVNGGWQVALVRIATWLRGTKMVVVGHSGMGWDDRNNLWAFPDYFVALSEVAKKWAKRANPFIRVEVIGDGVNIDVFQSDGEKARVRLGKPIVLAAGALEKSKRMDLVIRAVSKIPNTNLLILGEGRQKKQLNRLGKKLLGKRFEIKSVSFSDMPKYYRAASVFTLPSWSREAFGMVYIEAMACGLPVVATKDELREEIVGDAGILIDPTDVEEYAKAIEEALEANWGNKPRSQAEKFSWDKMADKYERLFKDLLK